jgi:hypothetical protein
MYKFVKNMFGVVDTVKNIETHACIPLNPENTDYQKYLAWVDEGNTPEPADE